MRRRRPPPSERPAAPAPACPRPPPKGPPGYSWRGACSSSSATPRRPRAPWRWPWRGAFTGRRTPFEAIVFAQVKISAINTAFTAIYLLAALPLFGKPLPFAGTLVAVTFPSGLIPVVGNLLSNTVIVVVSLGVSAWVAVASLLFLVVVHKLEYVLNAHIVGVEISAAAWEILTALFVFEAVFGVPGVIVAPIAYAYAK